MDSMSQLQFNIDTDSLREIFKYLFTIKNRERREKDGLFSRFLPDCDLQNPNCPQEVKERFSEELIRTDRDESVNWASVRSVCKQWNLVADQVFDFGSHEWPFLQALRLNRRNSVDFYCNHTDEMLPILLMAEDFEYALERKPKLWDELVDSLMATPHNLEDCRISSFFEINGIFLKSQKVVDLLMGDGVLNDDQFESILKSCILTTSDLFLRRAMRGNRIRFNVAYLLNRCNWVEGMKIYLEEGGDPGALFENLTLADPLSTNMKDMLLENPSISRQNKVYVIFKSVAVVDADLDRDAKNMKLTEEEANLLILSSSRLFVNEDPEGKGLEILLKYTKNPPQTTLDAVMAGGNIAKLRVLLSDGRLDFSNGVYIASVLGNAEMMREMIKSGKSSQTSINASLKKAAVLNEIQNLSVLIDAFEFTDYLADVPALFFLPNDLLISHLKDSKYLMEDRDRWIQTLLFLSPFRDDSFVCEKVSAMSTNSHVLSHALTVSAFLGKLDCVKILLENKKTDISFRNYACVRLAKENGKEDVYEYLLERGGKLDPIIHPRYYPQRTYIIHTENHIETERRAFITDPQLNGALTQYLEDREAAVANINPVLLSRLIMHAVFVNDLGLLQKLLEDPIIDPSVDDSDCLIVCAKQKDKEGALRLILRDTRVDPGALSGRPIKLAAEAGNLEMVKILAETGRSNLGISNALESACEQGYLDIAEYLLSRNEINLQHYGGTAFLNLMANGSKRAKKIALLMYDDVKSQLSFLDDRIPTNATFEEVCKITMRSSNTWVNWMFGLELAVIAGVVIWYNWKR